VFDLQSPRHTSTLPNPAIAAADLAIAISLVASTGRVSVLPLYARIMLPPTVVSRPIDGAPPMINLPLEYSEAQGRYGQDWRARWWRSSCRLRILR
jgi:hypothetical protein